VPKNPPLALRAGLILTFLVAAAVLAGIYLFLPAFLERSAARGIQDQLKQESAPEVEFWRGSLLEVLAGRFPGGRITVENGEFGDVRAEQVIVDLDPMDLNLPASILRGMIESEKPPSGTLRAEVSEGEVSRLTQADVPVREVELEKGRVLVRSGASVLGYDVPVSVQGSLALRGRALVFEARRASALGTPVPEQLREQLLAGADFAYPLGGLQYGTQITGVDVDEDRLILSGEMERVPMNQSIG
jgi:LmeA-like phospholipid-binding